MRWRFNALFILLILFWLITCPKFLLKAQDFNDTVLILCDSDLGTQLITDALSTLDITLIVNPVTYNIQEYKAVIVGNQSWGPSDVDEMRLYLQEGGGIIATWGVPFFMASSTNLESLQDMIGVSRYGNYCGHILCADDNPFNLNIFVGDTIGYTTGGGCAAVYQPVDSLLNRFHWGNGYLFSYAYLPYKGKYSYFAGIYGQIVEELFSATVSWMITDCGIQIVTDQSTLLMPFF